MKWNNESSSIFPLKLEVWTSSLNLNKSLWNKKGSDLWEADRTRIFEESFSDFLFFAHLSVCLI